MSTPVGKPDVQSSADQIRRFEPARLFRRQPRARRLVWKSVEVAHTGTHLTKGG
jgi:hypothetical protein